MNSDGRYLEPGHGLYQQTSRLGEKHQWHVSSVQNPILRSILHLVHTGGVLRPVHCRVDRMLPIGCCAKTCEGHAFVESPVVRELGWRLEAHAGQILW